VSAIAAGVTCSGPSAHQKRHWMVDAERRLSWRDPGSMAPPFDALKRVRAIPVPGTADVLTCDAWNVRVLLADGAAYAFDFNPLQPSWLPLTRECENMSNKDAPRPQYVLGVTGCGGFMSVVDQARRVWTWSMKGRGEIGSQPVPGTGRVLAVDADRATVILDTGETFIWTASGWGRLPALGSTSSTVRVRGIGARGFGVSTTAGELFPDTVMDLPVAEALHLIKQGYCVVETP
jgi:hypothetical protein